jgi:predicted GNAT superfamily acetyltransferase
VPAELERWQREGSSEVGDVQAHVREEFTKWFAKGYAAIGLRTGPENRAYLLTAWSDF